MIFRPEQAHPPRVEPGGTHAPPPNRGTPYTGTPSPIPPDNPEPEDRFALHRLSDDGCPNCGDV